MKRYAFSLIAFAVCLLLGCGTEPGASEHTLQSRTDLLTQAQCEYFAAQGTTRICHRTGSRTKPYVILNVSEQSCVDTHANHPEDYVAVDDPTCKGLGCLPRNAPCDESVGCCDGLSCLEGVCTCVPTSCAAAGVTCGSIADGCGGTLDCGPCITCPCASQAGWGTGPVDSCTYSTSVELFAVSIAGEVSVSGGNYAAMKTADEQFCIMQFPQGAFSQYTSISPAEYEVCKAEVQAVMQASQLETCELWHVDRCYPNSCADQGVFCGTVDDGCGNTLDCGPCGACPCAGQPGWGDPSLWSCAGSDDGLTSIAYRSGWNGSYGVSQAPEGTRSCSTQGPFEDSPRQKLLSADEYAACAEDVQAAIQQSALSSCRPYAPGTGCVPASCEELGAPCGLQTDGCGHPLDCGPCGP